MEKTVLRTKSKYIGVYKNPKGLKPWISYINAGELSIALNSDSENKAAIKYNILATFFQGKAAKLNDIEVSSMQYRKIARELFYQLTTPTDIQKAISNQGYKKYQNASTEYVGVYEYKKRNLNNPYNAYICKDKKNYSLGYYKTAYEAGAAYNVAARALYGDSAKLNKIDMDFIDNSFTQKVFQKLNLK